MAIVRWSIGLVALVAVPLAGTPAKIAFFEKYLSNRQRQEAPSAADSVTATCRVRLCRGSGPAACARSAGR